MSTKKQAVQTSSITGSTALRTPVPRANFGDYTPSLMELYQTYERELYIEGFKPKSVLDALATYRATLQKEQALIAQLKELQGVRKAQAAAVWVPMLAVYSRAVSAARTNGAIKAAISLFAQFMRSPHRKATATPAPTTSSAPTGGSSA